MKNLVMIKRSSGNAHVDAIELIDEYGYRISITKRWESGRSVDGTLWTDMYYDILLPNGVYLRSDTVVELLDHIELNGYKLLNPFKVNRRNW